MTVALISALCVCVCLCSFLRLVYERTRSRGNLILFFPFFYFSGDFRIKFPRSENFGEIPNPKTSFGQAHASFSLAFCVELRSLSSSQCNPTAHFTLRRSNNLLCPLENPPSSLFLYRIQLTHKHTHSYIYTTETDHLKKETEREKEREESESAQ